MLKILPSLNKAICMYVCLSVTGLGLGLREGWGGWGLGLNRFFTVLPNLAELLDL